MPAYVIVAAIIRRGDDVLLIRHGTEFGSAPFWAFPGGTANAGESAYDAVTREVFEETGLHVRSVGPLAYVTQHLNQKRNWQSDVFCLEILTFDGVLDASKDPDGDILEARFFPIGVAAELLERCPFEVIGRPGSHYLRMPAGDRTPFWIFREDVAGEISNIHSPLKR